MPKFLLDAQLPARLKELLSEFDCESIHTLDFPSANRTKDSEIIAYSITTACIVITKDTDFVESYLLKRQPEKILLLSCGNLNNHQLEFLLRQNLTRIIAEFEHNNFIEITRTDLIVHS